MAMVVMGPADRKRYEWTDLKQLPTEISLGAGGTTAARPRDLAHDVEPNRREAPRLWKTRINPASLTPPRRPTKSPPTGKDNAGKDKSSGKTANKPLRREWNLAPNTTPS